MMTETNTSEENAFEDERISMSIFDEKIAKKAYRMSCEPKAAMYIAHLNPPKKEKKNPFGRKEVFETIDLSDALKLI